MSNLIKKVEQSVKKKIFQQKVNNSSLITTGSYGEFSAPTHHLEIAL